MQQGIAIKAAVPKNQKVEGGAEDGKGITKLSAANTFSGTATTTKDLGTLALNNVDALKNATLDTGVSGTQAVTFVIAGTNTYNIGALTGSDALGIGGNSISVGTKAADTSFAADISGASGGLTKVGSNKLTLTAGTSYTGATQVTGGTLALSGSGTVNGSSGISINGSGAKLLHTGSTAISPAVTLTNGTLTIRCKSTAWATQLRLMQAQILEKINAAYPEVEIKALKMLGPDAPSWKKGPRSVPGRGPRDTYG